MHSYESAKSFSFKIDGEAHVLQPVSISKLDEISRLDELEKKDVLPHLMKLFKKNSDARTFQALSGLSFASLMKLFKDWTGLGPGELSSSPSSTKSSGEL